MSVLQSLHDGLLRLSQLERRVDPFFRPLFDALFREQLARVVQRLINARRKRDALRIGEERELPGETGCVDGIIADMSAYMRDHYRPGRYRRAGNTRTHGIVRGELAIRDDIPVAMRHGVASPRTFRARVRFAGPGPASPPDIDDVGVLSIGIKLMGVVIWANTAGCVCASNQVLSATATPASHARVR